MYKLLGMIVVLLLTVICYSSAVPPIPPSNEAILYVNGIGVLQNDYLLMTSEITATNSIQCIGGNEVRNISWILPNGLVLASQGTTNFENIRLEMSSSQIARLSTSNNMVSLEGIYRCRTEFNSGSVHFSRVWIFNDIRTAIPAVNTTMSSCSYIGTDVQNETHGILVSIDVHRGPLTNINCKWNNQNLMSIVKTSISNNNSTLASVVVSLPFLTTTNAQVDCTVSNRAGSAMYSCAIEANRREVSITDITRSSTTAAITWRSNDNSNKHVVVESTDGSDYIQLEDIQIMQSQATVEGLHPPLNYYVIVSTTPVQSAASNSIVLPSVSQRANITAQQCSPSHSEMIELDLKMTPSDDDACSSLSSQMSNEIVTSALRQSDQNSRNCSISNVQIMSCGSSKSMSKESSKSSSKSKGSKSRSKKSKMKRSSSRSSRKYTKVSIQAQMTCGPCSESGQVITYRGAGTRRTPGGRGRGGRSSLQKMKRKSKSNRRTKLDDITVASRRFTGYLNMPKTSNKYCGHSSSRYSNSKCNLVDCPSQCYAKRDRQYQCLAD